MIPTSLQPCWLDGEVVVTALGRAMVARGELELVRCSICTRPVWWWPTYFAAGAAPICARALDPSLAEPDLDSCFARVFLAVN